MFLLDDLLDLRKILFHIGICHLVVGQVASQVLVVGGHVDQAVAGEVEQDRARLAFDLGLFRFADGGSDSVGRFGSRYDALTLRKERGGLECFKLLDIHGIHQAVLLQLADDRACTVVTQAARMDIGRREVVSQRVHRQERGVAGFIAEVVLELPACQFRARSRFGGHDADFFSFRQLVAQEKIPYIRTGQGKRGEILISRAALLEYLGGAA